MFGLEKKFKEAHVLSHLEEAAILWLQSPGNPIMAKVPAAVQPVILAELQELKSDADKAISTPASSLTSTPPVPVVKPAQ